jgi:metal-sulfur cluster biosynthetic enzyme
MKAFYTGLMIAGLLVVTGCNTSSSGGKPGEPGGGFKLKGPANTPETTVKHGDSVTKEITIDPDKNFKEDLTFTATVEPADKGVEASVEPKVWKASEVKKVELHVKATDKAAQGEYTIHVKAAPAKGNPTTVDVKVKVPEKK